MASHVVGEADPGLPHGSVLVIETGLIEGSCDAAEAKLLNAFGIDKRLPRRRGQKLIRVAGVAKQIIGRSLKFVAKAQVQGQILPNAIVILYEPGIAGNAIIVITQATPTFTQKWRPGQETLESGHGRERRPHGYKEHVPVVGDRQIAA